jgi:phage/plasmid-like protein (TIGR03299 family)
MEDLLGYDPTVSDWGKTVDIAEGPNHQIDGDSFAGLRPAWHKLGTVWNVETMGKPNALGMLQLANADYDVFAAPVTTKVLAPYQPGSALKTWQTAEDPKIINICRMHPVTHKLQIIGQGSPGKKLWTNREIFVDFADAVIDTSEPTVSTCGVTREGRSAFMCFKLPKGILVAGEDAAELWMTIYTSYDSSAPTTLVVGPVRTVCQNTWNYNLKKAVAKYTIKRTANAKLNVQQAKTALKLAYAYADAITTVADALVAEPMSTAQFQQLMTKLWGPDEDKAKPPAMKRWEEKLDKLTHLFAVAPTQEPIRGTAWAAVQTVTEFCDWETKVDAKVANAWTEVGGADAYRVWRGITREKSVTKPKNDILAAVLETYGYKGTEVGQLVGV